MVPQPDDPQSQNEETYEQLISLIENSQGRLAPIIVACDDAALRQRIILRYESEARQVQIRPYRIVLGQEPSLQTGLKTLKQQDDYLQRGGAAVFTVTGAEVLLRVKLHPQEEQSELDKFFGYLQWTREGLREFRYPIVLWVTQRILRELSRRAPDFWSWRKAVLRFANESLHAPRLPIIAEQPQRSLENSKAEFLPPLAELQAEIAELTQRDPDAPNLATLYDRLGQVYAQRIRQGIAQDLHQEREQTIAAFQKAIDRYRTQANQSAELWALNRLGNFFDSQSRYPEEISSCLKGISYYEKSLRIAREIGDHQGEATSLNNLGNAYYSLGQYQRAIDFYQQSLEIQREIGDRQREATSLNNLGNAYYSLGKYQQTINHFQQLLEIQREIDIRKGIPQENRQGEASFLNGLGSVYASSRQYQWAIDFFQQSLEIFREIGDCQGEATSLNGLGNAYSELGQYPQAIDFYQQSLEIFREIGDREGEASSLNNLGNAYGKLGQYQWAIDFYQQSLEISRAIGDCQREADAQFNLTWVLVQPKHP
jgi:tetratricopeptide (TPR) repeat protein